MLCPMNRGGLGARSLNIVLQQALNPLADHQHYTMLARNLLYTSVTRGKRLVVLIGQLQALAIAVKNGSARRRWSKLGEWLGGAGPVAEFG